jgi:PAS domain S-box-containing protein
MNLRLDFETRVLAAFAAAVLIVATLAVLTWKVAEDALEAGTRVARTLEVLDVVADTKVETVQIELSTQNYRLTGDAAHLVERDRAIAAREAVLRRIEELTRDKARQQERLQQLRAVVEERLANSRPVVLLRETGGAEAAKAYIAGAPLQETRTRLFQLLREMEDEEHRLLGERSTERAQARSLMVMVGASTALVLVALLAATFFLIRQQTRATEASRRALRESEESLATTLHSIGDAVLATDTDGRITRMNPVAERLTGWPLAEARGRPADEVLRVFDAQTRTPAEVPVAKVLATGAVQGLANDTALVARDGTECPVADCAAPIRDATGRLRGVVLVFREVTAERCAERVIREQNELLEQRVRERTAQLRLQSAALDAAANAIVITDRDSRILWVNRAFSALTGYAAEEVIGQNPRLLKSGVQGAEFYRRMRETIRAGRVWRGEIVNRYKDGRLATEDMTITPLHGDDGNITHFIAIKQDATERKRTEDEIREVNASLERRVADRTVQLEEANRAKSDFLANMSHELRTPLNAIIGFAEMLKDGVLGELEAKQRGFAGDIFNAGTHLLALINDILDLSKVEAGKLELAAGPVDVAALLQSSLLVVREKALAHRIQLDTRIAPALGTLLADERKMKQIVYNLLSNAVKFTPEGGTVTLSARRCSRSDLAFAQTLTARVVAQPQGDADEFLEIAVEDCGAGIAERELPKLFEPFVQVDSSVDRRFGGTGLGLSLVRRLAELHGGTVGVASRPGEGSRFLVWLPWRSASPAAEGEPVATGSGAPQPAEPLALVIEDDDSMADLIAAQLRAEGFHVNRAATAEEGLVRAAKSRPKLITLDIFLPEMDGWEFMRRLKADPRLADIPVVIITISEDRDRGLVLGAQRVLQKPFAREELVAALSGLIEARPDGAAPCVLVVDDNAKAVELLATMIEAEGFLVRRAYGGAEAIESVRRTPPDVVILDLMMPDVSGFEVARALRESAHTARIPILVLTAKDLTAEDRVRLSGEVSVIMAKASFSARELLAELRRALPVRAS